MNCRFRTVKQFQDIPLYFVLHSYWLNGPGIESRCRRNFLHPYRPALRPSQRPAQWLSGISQGVKRPECGLHHAPTSGAEVKERLKLKLYSPFLP